MHNTLLMFSDQAEPHSHRPSIRCFPRQTWGVSAESPTHFHNPHSLVSPNGYLYQHEHQSAFEYHSQRTPNLSIHGSTPTPPPAPLSPTSAPKVQDNPLKFHLKKGRLTDFVDKNGWMGTVYILTGDERTGHARQLSNHQRNNRICSLPKRAQYDHNPTSKKHSQKSTLRTLEDIMSEKIRIRSRRNDEAHNRTIATQRTTSLPRTLSQNKCREHERDSVKEAMNKTIQTFYSNLKGMREREKETEWEGLNAELQQWQRTARTKWNQPLRNDSLENEEDLHYNK